MNRKVLLLNLTLLGLAVALVWLVRTRWKEGLAHQDVLSQPAKSQYVLPPPSPPPVKPAAQADYLEVTTRTLFSKDRNPAPMVDAPPPAPPPPPMPPLPTYFGQMNMGEPVAFLSLPPKDQRGYRVGESLGDFKLLAFNTQTITFEWNGKPVERKLFELAPKDAPPPLQVAAAPPPAGNAAGNSSVVSLSGGSLKGAEQAPSKQGEPAGELGFNGWKACAANDKSPPGTISGGYKKVVIRAMFGENCYWEKEK